MIRSTGSVETNETVSQKGRRLTVVLVAIVIFFLLLVTPSELLHLCYYVVRHHNAPSFELALVLANVLQTANFALNFLLYCTCNSQFRDTWKHLFCSRSSSPPSSESPRRNGIMLDEVGVRRNPRGAQRTSTPQRHAPNTNNHRCETDVDNAATGDAALSVSTCHVDVHASTLRRHRSD